MSDFRLDFQDTETAFAHKTDAQLRERYWLFRMLNSPVLNAVGSVTARLSLSIGLPIEGIIKSTIFHQFCGGENIDECEQVISSLGRAHIGTILDYSVEGKATEEDFDKAKDEIIRTIRRAKDDERIPFAVFKLTGIAPLGTLERLSAKKKLDAKSQAKFERINTRVNEICQVAYDLGQPIFIDAEESWIQGAIDRIAHEMMERFNREQPIVFNTIQLYRKDRLEFLKNARRQARMDGYIYAAKLVRGAYMEKERERAAELNYPSPIHETRQATDNDYNAAIDYCMKHVNDMAFVAATHNEESVQRLVRLMHHSSTPANHKNVHFSQLYGMGDNISYVLAAKNYNVSKYVPYGPVAETIPYLIRRAKENSSTAGQVSRELELIRRELKRRKLI